jgi:hypothetical protein
VEWLAARRVEWLAVRPAESPAVRPVESPAVRPMPASVMVACLTGDLLRVSLAMVGFRSRVRAFAKTVDALAPARFAS